MYCIFPDLQFGEIIGGTSRRSNNLITDAMGVGNTTTTSSTTATTWASKAAVKPPSTGSGGGVVKYTMDSLISKIKEVFPHMHDVDIVDHFMRIKAANNGSLAGISVDQIIQLISSNSLGDLTDEKNNFCAICIEPLYDSSGKAVTSLEGCGHAFHADCIQLWLTKKQHCPCCRKHQLPAAAEPRRPSMPSFAKVASI